MWANGPASRSGSALGSRGLVDQGVPQVLLAQHLHQAFPVVVGLDQVVDDLVHVRPFGGDSGLAPALAS